MFARGPLIALTLASCMAVAQAQDEPRTKPIGGYFPSTAIAVIGAALFGLTALIQWSHFIRNRKDRAVSLAKPSFLSFSLTTSIGLTCMCIGFIVRIYNATSKSVALGSYIAETMFILLSPCAFLAVSYITFGHLSRSYDPTVTEACLFVSPKRNLSKWFVWADVVSFFLLASGGGMTATASMAKTGNTIAMIGLVLQCVTYGFFTFLLIFFAWRLSHQFPAAWSADRPTSVFRVNPFSKSTITDKRVIFTILGLNCVGILLRCVFRVVEYAGGYEGYLRTTEVYIVVLDFLPLLIVMNLYSWVWPTRALRAEVQQHSHYGMTATVSGEKQ